MLMPYIQDQRSVSMMATMVPVVGENSTEIAAYVFLDPGSFVSFIRKGFLPKVRAEKVGAPQLLTVNTLGARGGQSSYNTQRVAIQVLNFSDKTLKSLLKIKWVPLRIRGSLTKISI